MSRVQPHRIEGKERAYLLDLLWTSVAQLNARDEVRAFFKDLLSESESIMLARRIKIAKRLLEGAGYDEIGRELKTSKATVATVHRWLSGGFGGYEAAVEKFEAIAAKRQSQAKGKQAEPYSWEWLKRRYPLHFLLLNMWDEARARREEQERLRKRKRRQADN